MDLRRRLSAPPEDAHGASWVLAVMSLAGALYGLLMPLVVPELAGGDVMGGIAMAAVFTTIAAGMLRYRDRIPVRWWVIAPFAASLCIATSNVATSDASTGSQLFLLWPCIYAALYLNVHQTVAALAVAMACEAAVVFTVMPASRGVIDLSGMMLVSAMAAFVIGHLRHRVRSLVRALEAQALEDQLTGLPNRRALDMAVEAALRRWARHEEPVTLLTLDVDRFKEINDRDGHAGGDRALREVAAVLRDSLRAVDTVARLGGDEFVVLLPGCGRDAAPEVAEKVRSAVSRTPSGVTVSVGSATVPGDADDAAGLFRASDAALYAAKHGGRNRVAAA
ncbi:MAG: GGDEF domain-containing protein [Thermoleophilia bacterium]